jgi:RNA 3'-terminal phosphate cyclase
VFIEPAAKPQRLNLLKRGKIRARRARAVVVNLPASMAESELAVIKGIMGLSDDELHPAIF